MILSDLTFIDDGNRDTTEDGLINWSKRTMLYSVLSQFLDLQRRAMFGYSVHDVKDRVLLSIKSCQRKYGEAARLVWCASLGIGPPTDAVPLAGPSASVFRFPVIIYTRQLYDLSLELEPRGCQVLPEHANKAWWTVRRP